MGNFDRKRESRGGFSGGPKRGFGGGSRGGGFGGNKFGGNRGGSGPMMHPATCAECGNRCEVPFKPMGGKPVYCKNCFSRDDDGGDRRPSRPQRDFGNDRHDRQDRQMHDAICDECGDRCEVPFRPTGEKPIYCRNCFDGAKDNGFQQHKKRPAHSAPSGPSNEQFEELSNKLDKALKILEILQSKKEHVVGKPKKNEAVDDAPEEIEEVVEPKKAPAKKAVAKKPAAKKAAPKKPAAKKPAAKKAPAKKKK